eukprot:m.40958 g.40958  ORF g.40958 m.40958 type:complete len:390 (+) comp9724_c0_seq1:194-1363(+)
MVALKKVKYVPLLIALSCDLFANFAHSIIHSYDKHQTITIAEESCGIYHLCDRIIGNVGLANCSRSCQFLGKKQQRSADVLMFDGIRKHPTRTQQDDPDQLRILTLMEAPAHGRSGDTEEMWHDFNMAFSYRFDADIPVVAGGKAMAILPSSGLPLPLQFLRKNPMMSTWLGSRGGKSGREIVLKGLFQEGITINSYGRIVIGDTGNENKERRVLQRMFRNVPLFELTHAFKPPNSTKKEKQLSKIQVSAGHMFMFAGENSICDHYHSEKVFHGLAAGSIPVYIGGKTIFDVVPENSIIDAYSFSSARELAQHMKDIYKNETLFESYHAWRKLPLTGGFKKYMDVVNRTLTYDGLRCFACERIHEAIERGPKRLHLDKSCKQGHWKYST